mgnify:CR=1 FL=1
MVFFVGVVVGGHGLSELSGYELSSGERQLVSSQLRGLPVSVQHAGVREAVLAAGMSEYGLSSLGMRSELSHAGVVRHGWFCPLDGSVWAIFELFDDFELVLGLVNGGHLQGLSLSHVGAGEDVRAVELALCSVPARGCCFIRHRCTTFEEAFNYKAAVDNGYYTSLEPSKMSSSPTASTEETPSRLEAVIASLSEADRTLVQARFSEMMAKVDDAAAGEASAKKRLEQLVAIKETDKKMFEEQFQHLLSFLPENLQRSYALTGETCKVLRDASPEVLHHVGQVVKCASAHFASRAVSEAPSEPRNKRSRVEEAVATSVTTPVSSSSTPLTPLQRALADTFRV